MWDMKHFEGEMQNENRRARPRYVPFQDRG